MGGIDNDDLDPVTEQTDGSLSSAEDPEDDDDEIVLQFETQQLLWAAIVILALIAVGEGIALASAHKRLANVQSSSGEQISRTSGGRSSAVDKPRDGDQDRPRESSRQDLQADEDGAHPDGQEPGRRNPRLNNDGGETAQRGEARAIIGAFMRENRLDQTQRTGLQKAMRDCREAMEELNNKRDAGEMTAEEHDAARTALLTDRRREITLRLGPDLSEALHERLIDIPDGEHVEGPLGTPPEGSSGEEKAGESLGPPPDSSSKEEMTGAPPDAPPDEP